MMRPLFIAACLVVSGPACAQDIADHTSLASSSDIAKQVASMLADMKPGQTFMWRPLLNGGSQTVALEIWKAPGKPAIHPSDGEYITVIQGRGILVTGGTMVNPHVVNKGQTDGDAIEGGTTRQLSPGDFVLIPAGTAHWFGIPGEPLVLLGTKIPQVVQ